jgi:hypothetical protein
MAHGRDKPKKEKLKPKKEKAPRHPAATRDQQVIATVGGKDRWAGDSKPVEAD